jgi:hypothetical protein
MKTIELRTKKDLIDLQARLVWERYVQHLTPITTHFRVVQAVKSALRNPA